jgi:hypothetical protein
MYRVDLYHILSVRRHEYVIYVYMFVPLELLNLYRGSFSWNLARVTN